MQVGRRAGKQAAAHKRSASNSFFLYETPFLPVPLSRGRRLAARLAARNEKTGAAEKQKIVKCDENIKHGRVEGKYGKRHHIQKNVSKLSIKSI